jgi:hypothetical protein
MLGGSEVPVQLFQHLALASDATQDGIRRASGGGAGLDLQVALQHAVELRDLAEEAGAAGLPTEDGDGVDGFSGGDAEHIGLTLGGRSEALHGVELQFLDGRIEIREAIGGEAGAEFGAEAGEVSWRGRSDCDVGQIRWLGAATEGGEDQAEDEPAGQHATMFCRAGPR